MRKLTKVAAAVSSALLMSVAFTARADITPFTPSAYAESELLVSNFQLVQAGGGSLVPLLGTVITNLQATVTSTLSASINGVAGVPAPQPSGTIINPLDPSNPTISHSVSAGPNAANYVPYTSYNVGTLGAGTFSGAASNHSGNGLQLNGAPTTTANTQAQVNINGSTANGSADSRQTLGTQFVLTITAPLTVDATFDAAAFIRVALGQDQVLANATRSWGLTVRPSTSLANLLDWTPQGNGAIGGSCVGLALCSVLSDSFDLNFETNTQDISDLDQTDSGAFGVRVTLPVSGTYIFTISHETNADAAAIPEPGSLALLAGVLLGVAGLHRKSKKA